MEKSMKDYYVYGLTTGYALFRGRARRREYWLFFLASLLVSIAISLIESLVLGDASWVSAVYFIATFIPGIAVGVRRLHDIDRTGWWWLILFVPIIGIVVFVIFLATAGREGENRFGPDPKAMLDAGPDAPPA
jgi:uncharacterized membrane protein YhaH (DUF805 family)